jgi:hypothetical protein
VAANEGNNKDTFYDVIKHSPRTSMETVIEAFLTLVTDKTRNSKQLAANYINITLVLMMIMIYNNSSDTAGFAYWCSNHGGS